MMLYAHALHFICVFYMLEPYVLVGLDWAEPMMLFLVARHMIINYSCIRTFFSFLWNNC